jgi:hypothetical protein
MEGSAECTVGGAMIDERSIGGAMSVITYRVTSGANPGLNMPLTGSPNVDIRQGGDVVSSVKK